MKGLAVIPSKTALSRAYNVLRSKRRLDESSIVRFAEWSRFDPRLGEILVKELHSRWSKIDVMKLRRLNLDSVWPQALAVIFEHIESLLENQPDVQNMSLPIDLDLFKHIKALVTKGISKCPYQSFTIGVFQPGGRLQRDRAERPHPFFLEWGFYESEPFFNKAEALKQMTFMDRATRKNILRNLLNEKREITINDYIRACRFAVQRRQAERDLHDFFKLKKIGNTRGAKYIKR